MVPACRQDSKSKVKFTVSSFGNNLFVKIPQDSTYDMKGEVSQNDPNISPQDIETGTDTHDLDCTVSEERVLIPPGPTRPMQRLHRAPTNAITVRNV